MKTLLDRFSWKQRIWAAAAALAVIGGVMWLVHWNQESDFQPLFSGLAAEDAGNLVTKLREAGVEYRLADNGSTVMVASGRVAEVRLTMATAGLPKTGRIGFELFDKANFGASEFAEQVNYHRAIEGELERSVMSIREVEMARVHITLAKESLYSEARQPAKASVLVKLRNSAGLSAQNVAAICQLTASAVPGLSADQVSLVDTNGTLLNRPRRTTAGGVEENSEAALEYRKSIERDLQAKLAATLEPMLGADRFRIGVSADVDLSSGDRSEETFDPEKSVLVMSQKTEDGPALTTASGVPGTASNLPRPTSKPSTGASNYARKTENLNFQPSRVVKHTRIPQGAVKKISLSVLVDHSLRWEGTGDKAKKFVEAPSAEKLKVIKDLVAATAGLDTARGDQLVVEAFPFESTLLAQPVDMAVRAAPKAGPSMLPAWLARLLEEKRFPLIAGIGAGAMLLLIGFFVMGLKLMRRGGSKVSAVGTGAIEGAKEAGLTAADAEKQIRARMEAHQLQQAQQEAEALLALRVPQVATKKTDVLVKHISAEAKKDPIAMAQVVRSWLDGENQR